MKAASLFVLLLIATVPAARACKYCQQAADPVEVMRFQGQGRNVGSFSPDDSLNNLGNGAPAAAPVAAPTTAPDPATLVTNAAALPARPAAVATAVVPAPTVVPVRQNPPSPIVATPPASVHWADFGLLGLVGAGGWFAWRTRGTARPVVA